MIGSIGFPEMILIFFVVLLVIGPKKLPQFAKMMGKSLRIFKDTIEDTKKSIKQELDNADLTKDLEDIKDMGKEIRDLKNIDLLDNDKK